MADSVVDETVMDQATQPANEPGAHETSDAANEGGKLFTPGFISLMFVSFFGAANDNILKQIITMMVVIGGLWANFLGAGTQAAVFLVLSVPFIFLSGLAGQVADKYSKRTVIVWVKILEIPIAVFALGGLLLGSFWMSLAALLMLAIQSSFYGPAKFGVIPEVVKERHLSRANGMLVGLTNLAVILGSVAAGPLANMYYPMIRGEQAIELSLVENTELLEKTIADSTEPVYVRDTRYPERRLPAGLALIAVAVVGLITALMMPLGKAAKPNLRITFRPLKPHVETLSEASRPLIVVLMSWSGFFLIGSLALQLLPEYRAVLGVSISAITNLVGLLGISVLVGSVLVGVVSGKTIRPYMSLLGAGCMTLCFLVMGIFEMTYTSLSIVVFFIGVFSGFYIVPLQSLLQYLSPNTERGRFFGTANTMSFVFISAASAIYYVLRVCGMPPERIPLVCAGFAAIGTLVGAVELHKIMSLRDKRHIGFENDGSAKP